LSTGSVEARADDVGRVAADVVASAIRNAVLHAVSVEGVPACTSPDGVPYDRR
jgi:L-aminopeptidase/D-esterase-like protein